MRSFLKFFFASFVALIVFSIVAFLFMLLIIARVASSGEKVVVASNSVLVIDLSDPLNEQRKPDDMVTEYLTGEPAGRPGLFDVVRLIGKAAKDDKVKGIYLKAESNANGYASSEELRRAITEFKKSKKFVLAYAEQMSQNAYYLASAADKVYLHPKGMIDFSGFSITMLYLKGTLEKLEIQPQIFYNGKFKSATEPLRETKMTEANRIQTTAFLGELYGEFLQKVSESRKVDTATLHGYANQGLIQEPADAEKYKLVDGLKYNDQVMDEIKRRLNLKGDEKVNFVSLGTYDRAVNLYEMDANIAVIYAEGDITGGHNEGQTGIASEDYIKLIREVRQDKDIKAIVFRVNSPGGSALASESIWRELSLARKSKPVIVSMGDYAASGGYYISCMADSIFAEPNTLTGSIGVFAVMPNMKGFFNNKLGITFDGVKTGEYADLGDASRPLTDKEKVIVQRVVDTIYANFKQRVTEGRKLDAAVVDSIAQGRVWTGVQAHKMGLVDRLGGLNAAIASAARMANLPEYKLTTYPKAKDPYAKLVKTLGKEMRSNMVKDELGEHYELYQTIKELKQMTGEVQAKLPYKMVIE